MNNIIIENLIAKICHDLMNPLNTAQMAIENNELEYIKQSIDDLILKVEIFRTLFKKNIDKESKYKILKKYIEKNSLNVKIDKRHEGLEQLIYCITNKMIKKSYLHISDNTIHMQTCFISEDEVNLIEKKTQEITSRNILFYLAIKNCENMYNLRIEELGPNEWKIIISNI